MELKCFKIFGPTLLLSLNLFAQNSNSQAVTQWKTNGNLADENHFIGTKNEFPVKFRSNNIERLRISPDGNVGIGLIDPMAKLDVLGNVLFRNNLTLTGLTLSNGLENQLLFVDETGNVKRGGIEIINNAMYQDKICGEGPIANPTWSNGINKIYVKCPQVNVGINTSTPRVNLDVRGLTYTGGLSIGTADPLNSLANFHMKLTHNPTSLATMLLVESQEKQLLNLNYQGLLVSRNQIIEAPDNTIPLIIRNSSQEILQLENNGLLRARRIKVDTDDWSDYVFDDNYILMPLAEVREFININRHLPGVPAEHEMIENGIDLGEINVKLLEKIEELTLYLLKQENEIRELNNRVFELEKTKNIK